MSGLGRKVFTAGEVLTAADVNGYLMDQTVMVFADATARTAAIAEPSEGMLTYLVDTAAYESWNGSAYVDLNDNTDAIPKSTVTTSQDLIVANGASSVTRLGVGTDDQVLSVVAGEVAWADAGGGGGMTLLASGTAGDTAVTLSSIPQTYRDLRLILLSTSTNKNVYVEDDNSGTDYTFKLMQATSTAFNSTTYAYFENSSGIVILDWKEYTTSSRHSGHVYVNNDGSSSFSAGLFFTPGSGAISSITFDIATDGSATYELYGVK